MSAARGNSSNQRAPTVKQYGGYEHHSTDVLESQYCHHISTHPLTLCSLNWFYSANRFVTLTFSNKFSLVVVHLYFFCVDVIFLFVFVYFLGLHCVRFRLHAGMRTS